ncbi:clustered mitochondria protein [Spatholobus suberectus]|nr:clustered mitochondria protein [Spatholobus suberectus]
MQPHKKILVKPNPLLGLRNPPSNSSAATAAESSLATPDGKLRYVGGHTRVLAVDRFIPFSELLSKLEELCGASVRHLRCQLPSEDLDALVSITSDEDLANLIEEYDSVSSLKIRAFLSPPRSPNKVCTPPSKSAFSSSSSASSSSSSSSSYCSPTGGGGGGSGRRYMASTPVGDRLRPSDVAGAGVSARRGEIEILREEYSSAAVRLPPCSWERWTRLSDSQREPLAIALRRRLDGILEWKY